MLHVHITQYSYKEDMKTIPHDTDIKLWQDLHVKPDFLWFLKQEVHNKFFNKIWVQCILDHLCSAKL